MKSQSTTPLKVLVELGIKTDVLVEIEVEVEVLVEAVVHVEILVALKVRSIVELNEEEVLFEAALELNKYKQRYW